MKVWILACAAFASLAWPAHAKDYALPPKGPAVTMAIPNDWDVTVLDNEVASIAPDGYLVLTIGFGKRSDLESLIKGSKDYLKESKVTLSVKPVEQTMDFAGTPGRVLRYATKGQNGKTIVDMVTLDASRDRVVLITVMGSTEERQNNEAALAAIMASIRVPAETGAVAAQPAWPGQPPKAAVASPAPVAEAKPVQPFAVRRAVFVNRRSEAFGNVDVRPTDTFAPGEALLSYIEPVGQALLPATDGKKRFGVIVDFEIRTRDGKVLGGQKGMADVDLTTAGDGSDPKFYVNGRVDLTGAEAGAYVLTYIVRDKLSERVASVDQPFTIVAAPVPAAPPAQTQAGNNCAKAEVRDALMAAVNERPAFRDEKRSLKALADAEPITKDSKPQSVTCRYTAIVVETQASGPVEKRMKMTFVMTADGKGEIDVDYSFDG